MIATASPKEKYKYEFTMHYACNLNLVQKSAMVLWLKSKPEFKNRRPTIAEFVKEAKRKSSLLYKSGIMVTDSNDAAKKYWYERAQYVLRHINIQKIEIKTLTIVGPEVPAYMPVKWNKDRSIDEENYIPTSRIMKSPELQETVLIRAYNDLQSWIARYERYSEFLEVFSPVIAATKRIKIKKK